MNWDRTRRLGAVAHAAAAVALLAAGPARALAQADSARPVAQAGTSNQDLIKVGDRILMHVDGEAALSDTFTVHAGPAVDLPMIGTIPLSGVSREAIEPYLRTAIARYLRNPVVHARALVWVGIVGEVAKPGWYAVPADALLSDALMAAGGMTRDARVAKVRIQRGTADVRDPGATSDALARGLTIAQIGVESGDQVVVPRQGDAERSARIVSYLLAIPVAAYAIVKLL